ncbi:MAG: branched-chain amino acid transaminase [Gemmatimonadetes bacterium]|nr:branched-chain amino acid transaminase [Gemmatimonadota bacterium]
MAAELIEVPYIWKEGELIPWHDAQIHVLSVAVQFGSSVFEGIRAYATPRGPAVFRLPEHLRRLQDSCRIYRMELKYSADELTRGVARLIAANQLEACYIRPMVLRGYGTAGLNPVGTSVETYIAVYPWGTYLGEGALEQGGDACVSTWFRPHPNTFPAMAKSAGHYNCSQLIKADAVLKGFAEGIALSPGGLVSEGSGQNVFLVRGGELYTPALDGSLLHGITRASVIALARDIGIRVHETQIPRETLYVADEVFFTGTAAELTPVRSIDNITIGCGRAGEITRVLQKRLLDIMHGRTPDVFGWLTYVADVLVRDTVPV